MFDNVRNYIRTCDVCQRRGPPERKEPLVLLAVKELFYQIGIDVKGPLPRTSNGNRYIIVAMDYFTKWPEARAIENMKADTIAKFIFEEIICRRQATVPVELKIPSGRTENDNVEDVLMERLYQI